MTDPTGMDDVDRTLLARAVDVARSARARGNHPFGSILADAGRIEVLAAENTVVTERDVTGHAETNLVRLASARLSPAELTGAVLYTSTEPCAMCAGAIYWSGISRVVFDLGEDSLRATIGRTPPWRCRAEPCSPPDSGRSRSPDRSTPTRRARCTTASGHRADVPPVRPSRPGTIGSAVRPAGRTPPVAGERARRAAVGSGGSTPRRGR